MGCDIHIIAEVKPKKNLLQRLMFWTKPPSWKVNSARVFPNPWYKEGAEAEFQKGEYLATPEDGRNYDWFSILADVRNGYGFAGVMTGQAFKVIAEPRGVPYDATKEWKETVERWDNDMHSKSYLTLEDFDSFDWNQVTMKTGAVTLEQYNVLRKENSVPNVWCGSVSGQNIVTISQEDADNHILHPIQELEGKTIYVQYYWPVIYRDWFEDKFENIIEPLRKLKSKNKDARLVFGFDN